MKRLAAFVLGLCLSASPAFAVGIAQIAGTGTGGAITSPTFNAGTSINLTTTADIPPASLAIVIMQNSVTGTVTGNTCTDAYGNTYTAARSVAAGNGAATQILYSYTGFDIPNAGTISCTQTSGPSGIVGEVLAFSGAASSPLDAASASNTVISNSTSPTTVGPTGTLNGPCGAANCEVLIGATTRHTSGTVGNDATFNSVTTTGAGQNIVNGYKIVSATTAVSYVTTTSVGTTNFAGQLIAFKAAAAGGTPVCTLSTLGVGSC